MFRAPAKQERFNYANVDIDDKMDDKGGMMMIPWGALSWLAGSRLAASCTYTRISPLLFHTRSPLSHTIFHTHVIHPLSHTSLLHTCIKKPMYPSFKRASLFHKLLKEQVKSRLETSPNVFPLSNTLIYRYICISISKVPQPGIFKMERHL